METKRIVVSKEIFIFKAFSAMTATVGAQVSAVVLSGIQLDHSTHPHLEWDSRLEVLVLGHIHMEAEHGQEEHMNHDQEHMDSERE